MIVLLYVYNKNNLIFLKKYNVLLKNIRIVNKYISSYVCSSCLLESVFIFNKKFVYKFILNILVKIMLYIFLEYFKFEYG